MLSDSAGNYHPKPFLYLCMFLTLFSGLLTLITRTRDLKIRGVFYELSSLNQTVPISRLLMSSVKISVFKQKVGLTRWRGQTFHLAIFLTQTLNILTYAETVNQPRVFNRPIRSYWKFREKVVHLRRRSFLTGCSGQTETFPSRLTKTSPKFRWSALVRVKNFARRPYRLF